MTPTDEVVKKKFEKYYKAPTAELIAYLDFSVSTTGILNGVKVSVIGFEKQVNFAHK